MMADANASQPAPAPDADTNPAETDVPPVTAQTTDAPTPAPVAEFDAFEGGPAIPTTPSPTATPDAQAIRDPGGRQSAAYITNRDVTVLRSTVKDVIDTWSVEGQRYQTQGGGIQYFVPDPTAFTPKP